MNENKNIDIMDVKNAPSHTMIWTDPPWENRMVKWFETKLVKDTGEERPNNTIEQILDKLASLADPNKPCFIEYGIKGYDKVMDAMIRYGHTIKESVVREQSSGNPYVILSFNTDRQIPKAKSHEIITKVVATFENPVVWDPFAGLGVTRKAVESGGGSYIGYEINKARFDRMNQ